MSPRVRHLPLVVLTSLLLAVVLAAPAAAETTNPSLGPDFSARYVALGDSYAAGPLVLWDRPGSLWCLRSTNNYPSLLARRLPARAFRDASCVGASTDDLDHAQRTGVRGSAHTWLAPPQLDALTPDTTLVTLSIGGNDIGFAEILTTCSSLSVTDPAGAPCRRHYAVGGRDTLQDKIAAAAPDVGRVLEQIQRRAPNARVLVVGYLRILPAGGGCWPWVPIARGDVAYLDGVETHLNHMLAVQAARHGAQFVDTYATGHDACAPPGERWVEGVVPTSPAAPVHPNVAGMNAVADRVLATLRGPAGDGGVPRT